MTPGSRLGPYEILAPLGAGGMGEVYRARDTRLGRTVAVKVLPGKLSADAERLARFEQEARSASALNHPHIVTVFDVGRSEAGPYIAMELVEGESLRDLLAPGPLPLRRALQVGAQLADGLAKAHGAGIVHRDLKPENIVVSRDGFLKILDFGLAKLVGPSPEDGSVAETVPRSPSTSAGTVLGTVGYMSPEQAAGRPVDFRSDQFSFGSILYETLSGRRAFARESAAETLTAIIREEPEPIEAVNASVPEAVRWVVQRCLAKSVEERYVSTRDLARELAGLNERLTRGVLTGSVEPARVARRSRFTSPWVIAGTLLIAFLIGALAIGRLRRAGPKPPVSGPAVFRFSLPAPPGTFVPHAEIQSTLAVSPDGKHLVIRAYFEGRVRLYVRGLDSTDTRVLEGTEGATSPFFSPDGRFVGFFAEGKLKKISLSGGPAETLCDARAEGSGSWGPHGDILFPQIAPTPGMYRVPSGGGKPERVTRPEADRKIGFDFWPQFLPDGKKFLYLASTVPGGSERTRELRIGALDGGPVRKLGPIETRTEYAAGFLLTVREGSLIAQRFDLERGQFEGAPLRVASGVHEFYGPAYASFSVSPGVLAYQTQEPDVRLAWFQREGRELSELPVRAPIEGFRVSPDGQRIALDVQDRRWGTSDIWIHDLARGIPTRVHVDRTDEVRPVWFPEGKRLAYRSDRRGPPDIYTIDLGISGSERSLLHLLSVETPLDVSPDGRWLAYQQDTRRTGDDLWLFPLEGKGEPTPFLQTSFDETDLQFSRDGRWTAYVSNESGRPEVYVTPFGRSGEKVRVSTAGGRQPRWRRDGGEIYWVAPGGELMAASLRSSDDPLRIGAPVALFRLETGIEQYDVMPDGTRFLVSTALSKVPRPPIEVVVNWTAALKP
jgi:Tol biopolymer transport system component